MIRRAMLCDNDQAESRANAGFARLRGMSLDMAETDTLSAIHASLRASHPADTRRDEHLDKGNRPDSMRNKR
jgi:hypothetical protein